MVEHSTRNACEKDSANELAKKSNNNKIIPAKIIEMHTSTRFEPADTHTWLTFVNVLHFRNSVRRTMVIILRKQQVFAMKIRSYEIILGVLVY